MQVGVVAKNEVLSRGGTPRVSAEPGALLTVQEVAEILKVPVSWVYERTRVRSANRLPGFRLGKYWRFRRGEVMAWLECCRAGAYPND